MIPQSLIDNFRRDQKAHVSDLSRNIIVGRDSTVEEDCPNCTYDGVSNSSGSSFTNFSGTITLFSGTSYERTYEAKSFKQRCPICGGRGYFSIPDEKTIKAHIHWTLDRVGYDSTLPYSPAGWSGQNSVKIKTDSMYYSEFLLADYFIIDGVRVEPASTPVIRSIQSDDGIVEIWCRTTSAGKETNS